MMSRDDCNQLHKQMYCSECDCPKTYCSCRPEPDNLAQQLIDKMFDLNKLLAEFKSIADKAEERADSFEALFNYGMVSNMVKTMLAISGSYQIYFNEIEEG